MKTSHVFVLAAAALSVGFLTARWCAAQPSNQPTAKQPATLDFGDFGAMEESASFETCLQQTRQSDILRRYRDLTNTGLALHDNSDLGTTLAALQALRDGHTKEAYQLLEDKMDTDIIVFAMAYRHVPARDRSGSDLKYLQQARDYRAKFPFKHPSPAVDQELEDAFKTLDENN